MDYPKNKEHGVSRAARQKVPPMSSIRYRAFARWLRLPVLALSAGLVALPGHAAAGAPPGGADKNLVFNGAFDDPTDPLNGWKYKFDLPGESWYFNNHEHVSVVDKEGSHRKVLALWGNVEILQVPGQGTKTESRPMPVKPGGKYRFTAEARSTGPDCRIMIEGYHWKPGVKPHDGPELSELRRCYRSRQLYFGSSEGGTMGGVGRNWQKSTTTFPKEGTPEEGQELFNKAEFMVVHIVAIGGSEGYLYVDNVTLERLN